MRIAVQASARDNARVSTSSGTHVLIRLRDGRTLQVSDALPSATAQLLKRDFEHWLIGSRALDFLDARGRRCLLQAHEVATIELCEDLAPEQEPEQEPEPDDDRDRPR